jgi:hypothetical protein
LQYLPPLPRDLTPSSGCPNLHTSESSRDV